MRCTVLPFPCLTPAAPAAQGRSPTARVLALYHTLPLQLRAQVEGWRIKVARARECATEGLREARGRAAKGKRDRGTGDFFQDFFFQDF